MCEYILNDLNTYNCMFLFYSFFAKVKVEWSAQAYRPPTAPNFLVLKSRKGQLALRRSTKSDMQKAMSRLLFFLLCQISFQVWGIAASYVKQYQCCWMNAHTGLMFDKARKWRHVVYIFSPPFLQKIHIVSSSSASSDAKKGDAY